MNTKNDKILVKIKIHKDYPILRPFLTLKKDDYTKNVEPSEFEYLLNWERILNENWRESSNIISMMFCLQPVLNKLLDRNRNTTKVNIMDDQTEMTDLENLKRIIIDKLELKFEKFKNEACSKTEKYNIKLDELKKNKTKIESSINQLQKDNDKIRQNIDKLDNLIEEFETQNKNLKEYKDIQLHNVLLGNNPLYENLLNAKSNDLAIEDTINIMSKSLNKNGALEFEQATKNVAELATFQFYEKAKLRLLKDKLNLT